MTGSTVQGQTLSTSNGSWSRNPTSYAYQWQRCNSAGASCTSISGATSSRYTLQSGDVGSTIRSVVTATNKGGSTAASSAATGTVTAPPPAAPTNTAAPAVSGQTMQGQTLSTSNGTWNGSPTSYAYQWQDCNSSGASCVSISGATSSSYTLQASDVGFAIRSVVKATNAGGSTSASSAATASVTAPPPAAPSNTAAPAVSGQDVQGQTLSTSNGSWNGSPTSYAYRWQDCNSSGASCVSISGATSSSYTLPASDVGSTIRSVVTATNAGGSTSASSAATAAVTAPPPAAPTNTAAPAVSGQDVQGQTLTTSNGSWTGSPTSYSYHWQDCNSSGASCTNISGATSSSYTLQAGDVGDTMRSVVTATNSGGSGSDSSAATGMVTSGSSGGGSTNIGAPTPSGVTCTQTLNAGANVQSAVSAASPGSVVCLNAGSWSAITLSSIAPASPGVTVAATPGQTVSVPGFTITGTSQNLTIEGFKMTSGAGDGHGNGIDLLCQINGGVTLTHNTIENISGGDAIHAYSGACGGSSATQTGVSITYNQLDHASTFVEAQGNACACASADVNWTISHNVMGPDENYGGAGHYIQGQWLGATIDNNAFEGPTVFNSNAHNNVLHCYTTNAPGCQNITFDNNIIWHAQSRAQTILISDNNLTNIHIDNNLDVDDPACGTSIDCPASPWFVEKGYGYMLMHNTSVSAVWSVNMGTCGDGCVSNPNTWDAEYNIAVGTPESGQNNYGTWACQTSCTLGHNTSQDGSASSDWGGSGDVNNWAPAWQSTSWTPVSGPGYQPPPAGYYQPTGLSISGAGYQGQIGP